MEYRGTILPQQKVSHRKKNQAWREQSVDAILSRSKIGGPRYQRQRIAYDIMNGDFDTDDLKYVTNPYKVSEGFPAKMQNINIIAPKINLLLGEETKRPQSYLVFKTGEAAAQDVLDRQRDMVFNTLTESLLSQDDSEEAFNKLQQDLQEIQSYVKSKYYDVAERTANNTLKYLREKLSLDDQFNRNLYDGLVSNDWVTFVGILNGEPFLERVNPSSFSYDRSPELKGIQYGDWAVRQMQMNSNEIHDRFYELMDEATFDKILKYINEGAIAPNEGTGGTINTHYIRFRDLTEVSGRDFNEQERKSYTTLVQHCVWRSYKKIGYLTLTDEEGNEEVVVVDEGYKADPGENIEWSWIDEIWEGYRVGRNIHFGIRPLEYQDYSVDDVKPLRLPFVGGWLNGVNADGKSLVEIMKPLQYFYLVLFYRLELTLARDRGKVINMDITQIPKSMGVNTEQWMHYLTSHGVNFINPYEEGWDVPGREGGKPATFNQITSVDLTMTNVIREYIELMNKIEEMIGELSGVSKARQGQIHQSSLVGNVRQEITQSSHITEPLFWRHNQFKKEALTLLLDVAKFAWRRTNKRKLSFILDGPERVFLDISDDFLYSDYDLFMADSTKDFDNMQKLEALYQPAMQNGASLTDIADIMTSNSISEIKQRMEAVEQQRQQMMQQQVQAEQQAAAQEQQLKAEELRIKEEDSIRKAETQLTIAMIGAEQAEGADIDSEQEKLELQREKIKSDAELKKAQLREITRNNKAKEQEAIRSNKVKEQIARSKPKTTTTKK